MTALLTLDGLGIDLPVGGFFSRRSLTIVPGVDLTLAPGESLALVGESGSGKTTIARAVMGLTNATRGTVTFAGRRDITNLRRASAMMFQDATASLSPRLTVEALVTEPFAIHGVRPATDAAATLLAAVGLAPTMAQRYPHELSGGQARRVGVARALALNPQLLVADEPTAGLDVSVQAEVLNLLSDLRRDRGLAMLLITHNLALVRHVTDRVAVLYLGRIVETGPTEQVFAAPAHPYTASLIAAEPRPDPRQRRVDLAIKGEIPSILRRPTGCEFHTRCPVAQPLCRLTAPPTVTLPNNHIITCHLAKGDHHALEH
jgi:peptide/nickel transport system ATP-binding protein